MNPLTVDDTTFAYGAKAPSRLLPKSVPDIYRQASNPWHQAAQRAYRFGFGPTPALQTREGINPLRALRHLGAIMASPVEEQHKIPALAALMADWFICIHWPATTCSEPEDVPLFAS